MCDSVSMCDTVYMCDRVYTVDRCRQAYHVHKNGYTSVHVYGVIYVLELYDIHVC